MKDGSRQGARGGGGREREREREREGGKGESRGGELHPVASYDLADNLHLTIRSK